jgi:hypothetical protein
MFIIILSSFKLVFDTYTDKLNNDSPIVSLYVYESLQIIYSSRFDMTFQIIFTFEMVLKVIAFGFIMDDNSYLRESWS